MFHENYKKVEKDTNLKEKKEILKISQDIIIKQMIDNSQRLKSCFMLYVAVFLGLFSSKILDNNIQYPLLFIIIPFVIIVIVFWFMDAKYLQLETFLKKNQDTIVEQRISYEEIFAFNINQYKKEIPSLFKIMLSWSLLKYPSIIFCYTAFCYLVYKILFVQPVYLF